MIDNGDTDILQSQIENNWSSDAWSLRNNLMQESPYLSTEALLTAAAENLLPNAMLLEVLLANPDATTKQISGKFGLSGANVRTKKSRLTHRLHHCFKRKMSS